MKTRFQYTGGGLILGDKRLAGKLVLKAPTGWDCPERLDNSGYCTPLDNQGNNPWCAAYSMEQLLSASYWREFHVKVELQQSIIYERAKLIDGLKGDGTTLEAVLKATNHFPFGLSVCPSMTWERVDDYASALFAVHKFGLVLVGLNITTGWQKLAPNGMIGPGRSSIGGHAVLISGYSLSENTIWGPNWWGLNWGVRGWWMMKLDQFRAQLIYGYAARIAWEKCHDKR